MLESVISRHHAEGKPLLRREPWTRQGLLRESLNPGPELENSQAQRPAARNLTARATGWGWVLDCRSGQAAAFFDSVTHTERSHATQSDKK